MHLIASCPFCGTSFRVRPEQLAAHYGDVRCGRCGDVFNANEHLAEVEEVSSIAVEEQRPGPLSESGNLEEPGSQIVAEPPVPLPDAIVEAAPEPQHEIPETQPAPRLTSSSSVQPKALPSWSMWPITLLLILAALGQTVYYTRTEIAASLPQSRPFLEKACAFLSCAVELPQRANLLSIEDTDLQEDPEHQGVYVLTCNLINGADFPQAYPSLELTLTDLYGKAVLRRVLSPEEYLPESVSKDGGLQASGEATLRIMFEARSIKATGYRIYVAYS